MQHEVFPGPRTNNLERRSVFAALPDNLELTMSRSGYTEYCEGWDLIRWRGAVASALRGKRGQAFLREAVAALDALPVAELITNDLAAEGAFCTLGAVGRARSLAMSSVDPEDHHSVAGLFAIPHALACEIMWENDEGGWNETPHARWERMRRWIVRNLRDDQPVSVGPGSEGEAEAPGGTQ